MPLFGNAVDLAKNELRNARIGTVGSLPDATADKGIFRLLGDDIYWSDGTEWINLRQAPAGSAEPTGPAGGDLTGSYPDPLIADGAVDGAAIAAAIKDPAAATAGLRTLGTGATQAAAGNDTRLSDERVPTDGSVTLAKTAAALQDPAAGTTGLRSLGTGATQAAAGNDARLSDERTPTDSSVTNAKVAAGAAIALSKLATDPLARANHTGSQPVSTLSDFTTAVTGFRLDQFAAPTAAVSLGSQRLTNVTDPTGAQDAATKAYVDATASGLDVKASVRAATTGNITLSGTQTVDGVALTAGQRVLVKNQSTGSQNGLYAVAAGAWTRTTDADASAEVNPGMFVFVEEGTANADSGWVLTNDGTVTLGTTALTFAQFSGAGQVTAGAGLTKTGNTLDVGAGTGITVAADSIAIDTAVVARKYATTLATSATSYTVNHALGTRDVTVAVYENSGAYAETWPDVEHTDTNNVTLRFGTAPTASQYRVVVNG